MHGAAASLVHISGSSSGGGGGGSGGSSSIGEAAASRLRALSQSSTGSNSSHKDGSSKGGSKGSGKAAAQQAAVQRALFVSTREAWVVGTMSNFDYLMFLNTMSGRSYGDLTQ